MTVSSLGPPRTLIRPCLWEFRPLT